MILHLGNDLVVYEKDIIIIIDAECAEARTNREFLAAAQLAGDPPEGAKSFVLVDEGGGCVVYPSPISSQTLLKRVEEAELF